MVSKGFIKFVEPLLFPVKLYYLAHSKEIKSINWSHDGTAVQIDIEKIREECFETKIFNVVDHRHVFRQLSYYGFQRTDKVARVCEFFHPRFLSDRLDLVKTIRRSGKKNRNEDITSLIPFIERRTSTRLQGKGKGHFCDFSEEASIKSEADSDSSEEYDSKITLKRRRKKTSSRWSRAKKSRSHAEANAIKSTVKHERKEKDFKSKNGNLENAYKHQSSTRNQQEDLDITEDITIRNRLSGNNGSVAQPKNDPSRHATRENNTVLIKEEIWNEDFCANKRYSKTDKSVRNKTLTSQNSSFSPIKLKIKGLSNSFRPSITENGKQSKKSTGKFPYVEGRSSTKNAIFLDSISEKSAQYESRNNSSPTLENNSDLFYDKRVQSPQTSAVTAKGNSERGNNVSSEFRKVPSHSIGKFILGKGYKWISVEEGITQNTLNKEHVEVDISPTTKNISATNQMLSSRYKPYARCNQRVSRVSQPAQSRIPVKSFQSEEMMNTRNSGNTLARSVNNSTDSSVAHTNASGKTCLDSLQSGFKTKQCGVNTDSNNVREYKSTSFQPDAASPSEEQIILNRSFQDLSILEVFPVTNQDASRESCNDIPLASEHHSSTCQEIAADSSHDSSEISVTECNLDEDSSSTSEDGSLLSQSLACDRGGNSNATQSQATVPEVEIEVEVDIPPKKKKEMVEYLYLQLKIGKMHSWDLFDSPDPVVRQCAYDALTLDVEKARGDEMDFTAGRDNEFYDILPTSGIFV